ncbi:YlbF family regulator [Anaerofilum sp. BX8]|uniref:YlbF family regulator n=1 Tax=Anaerofilum hominis TaxID=2763016 RepID=A0A923I6T8_9FIRM|nr:YlbF family regulator [Anaerofilum hominis]MBC5580017.1 YlbF family regulator [Anaerofilum hominis]
MDIIDQVRALALELQKDQRYLVLENARRMNDADEELQQQIGEFNLARIDLNNEVSKQEKNAERITELNEKIQSIYTDVMNNESMQAYNEAKNEMDSLMQYINAILTTAVNGGDPMTVEEPSSCGGDCSGCSGCH